jgi:hypothetical protein
VDRRREVEKILRHHYYTNVLFHGT